MRTAPRKSQYDLLQICMMLRGILNDPWISFLVWLAHEKTDYEDLHHNPLSKP